MFKNTFQSGFLSILYSIGSKPLQIWEKEVRNGHIKRITDNDIQSSVLEIMSTNISTTFITCPADTTKTLGIKLPFLVMIIKNVRSHRFASPCPAAAAAPAHERAGVRPGADGHEHARCCRSRRRQFAGGDLGDAAVQAAAAAQPDPVHLSLRDGTGRRNRGRVQGRGHGAPVRHGEAIRRRGNGASADGHVPEARLMTIGPSVRCITTS